MNFLHLSQTVNDKAATVRFLRQRGILHNPRICANFVRPMTLNLRPTKVRWLPFHCRWTHMQFCRPSNWCSHAKQRTHGKTRSKETKDSTVLIARCLKAIPANGCVGNVLEMWTFLTRSWVISLPISLLSNRSRHFLLTSYNAKILF